MTEEANKPLVTVLMAVYNSEKYLKEAVSSILSQTFTDFEFLIINDGSTDKSAEIVKSFHDKRIKVVNNVQNIGVIRSLNKAVEYINGEYVARMDSDDICVPDRLEKEIAIFKKNPDVSIVAANVALVDKEGNEIGSWNEDIDTKTHEEIYRMLPYENCIANPTVMIKASLLKKYKYNAFQKSSEDWDMWLNMASDGEKFYKINEALVKYRIHSSSITAGFNRRSIYRKKNSIQVRYFITRILKGRINKFDFRVLKNGIINYFKFILNALHPSILPVWTRLRSHSFSKVWVQFKALKKFCRSGINNRTSVYFFFPYYHIGGAEKVHAQIMEAVADKKPVCFITGVSSDNGFYADFKKSATLVDISLLTNYPVIGKRAKKIISKFIGRVNNAVTFSCNSKFYYDIVPYFAESVKCIDLIHAFVHKGEEGAEYWSLPVVQRIDKRVVITKKTIRDFKMLYKEHQKSDALADRIMFISNFTEVPSIISKPQNKNLKILYVGRNGREKRIYLIGRIASEIAHENINAEFELVGDMGNIQSSAEMKYCKFRGLVSDEKEMQNIYRSSDILVLTSTREGFPMVIMEAMAYGLAVITTDVGGIKDHIINHENGMLISSTREEDIVHDFVEAIRELNSDKEKLKDISQKAHQYASENFGKERFVKLYRDLLLTNSENNG